MFETISVTALALGTDTDNKIAVLSARINQMDIIADVNYMYIKDGLYYTQINKQVFIREFMGVFRRMVALPNYPGKLWRP